MQPTPLVSGFYGETSVHKAKPTGQPGLTETRREERLDWCEKRALDLA